MSIDLKELAEELDDLRARVEYADENPDADDAEPLDDDEQERLAALEDLEGDLDGDLHVASRDYSLIAESDFEDYAQQYAVDTGIIEERYLCYFDSEKFTSDLQGDYTSVEFDGETYYYNA